MPRRRLRPGSRPTSCSARPVRAGPLSGPTRTGSPTSRAPSDRSADAIEAGTLLNGSTGRRGLYGLPMGRYSNNIHVWNGLLERRRLHP
jgi:hypothetical protein